MVGVFSLLRYTSAKFAYSLSATRRSFFEGKLKGLQVYDSIWDNLVNERMTMLCSLEGEQMPTLGTKGVLLVRKIPSATPKTIRIGDVVVLKDPRNVDNLLARRITALENWKIEPTNEKDRSFVLVENQCWVLADNQELNPEEARDSRVIGPVYMPYIVGRAIYFLTSAENHGIVNNSRLSQWKDSAVLRVERDIDLMIKHLEA